MKRRITQSFFVAAAALYAWPALALTADKGAEASKPNNTPTNLFTGDQPIFQTIAEILIFLTGSLAVIVLIFGGLRYVTSTGDAARVKSAKDTIMYGVIGVVVAILAYAIVAFVTDSLTNPQEGSGGGGNQGGLEGVGTPSGAAGGLRGN